LFIVGISDAARRYGYLVVVLRFGVENKLRDYCE
jgi:hypothetical protein